MNKALLFILFALVSLASTTKKNISAELENEVNNVSLQVSGKIPSWLKGTFIRNGPVTVTVDGKSNQHWFDGLAMLHAFSFQNGEILYSNKFLQTDAYRTVFKEGSLDYEGFASDPCRSIFRHFLSSLLPEKKIPNANVNVAKFADSYVALTEVPLPVRFDPHTLKTLGMFEYQDDLPKSKIWEAAHPHHFGKETLSYFIDYGRKSFYKLYALDDEKMTRRLYANVESPTPSYMHSFAVTENYTILTEFPLVVEPLDLLVKNVPFIKNFKWGPSLGTQFIIVDRKTGNIVKKLKTRPFFAFHHANAFEENDLIHVDMVTYEDAKIITEGDLDVNVEALERKSYPTKVERFTIELIKDTIQSATLLNEEVEFPRINDDFDGKPYRFLYLAGVKNNLLTLKEEKLFKLNTETQEVLSWGEAGCSPGEPIFVASPQRESEDDGIVMSIIFDKEHHTSFLLFLDGKTFKEIGRATTPHQIPMGLHGQFFK